MILVRVLQLVDNLRAIADVVIDSTSQVIYSFWGRNTLQKANVFGSAFLETVFLRELMP